MNVQAELVVVVVVVVVVMAEMIWLSGLELAGETW